MDTGDHQCFVFYYISNLQYHFESKPRCQGRDITCHFEAILPEGAFPNNGVSDGLLFRSEDALSREGGSFVIGPIQTVTFDDKFGPKEALKGGTTGRIGGRGATGPRGDSGHPMLGLGAHGA
jgi:hypothetical protein